MTNEDILNAHQEERTKLENYTRVMGYIRPVSSFNIGKTGEYQERKFFTEKASIKENNKVD